MTAPVARLTDDGVQPHKPIRVMACFGTRPEAIKLAPVVEALRSRTDVEVTTVVTGQHREMLDQTLRAFGLEADVDLGLMEHGQDLATLTSRAIPAVSGVLAERRPDVVIVQGDTTTAFCGALAAYYHDVAVAHVEAGLRTHDLRSPFPEEGNRRMIGQLARWHFCTSLDGARNLAAEGIEAADVLVTGNTVIDALLSALARPLSSEHAVLLPPSSGRRRVLVTLHRRETQGAAQRELCRMLADLVRERPDVEIVFPVHLSPAVRASVLDELGGVPSVHLIDPLPYQAFVYAMRSSDVIVTDSGGVQEEAPALGVPVLVMREATERPEGVAAGCARLSGTAPGGVRADLVRLLDDARAHAAMAAAANPYGDGRAADRIADRLLSDLGHGSAASVCGEAAELLVA